MATNTYYHVGKGGVHAGGRHFSEGIYTDKALNKAAQLFPHVVKVVTADEAKNIAAELKAAAEKAAKVAAEKSAAKGKVKVGFTASDEGGAS